ncbi:glycosyltransferase [Lichenicoccus sp.]|uniref:glycosyltransferase n=1 Tax=Lichenicoccus sp. TaxID=2781899 RepID=UPI003D0EA2D3
MSTPAPLFVVAIPVCNEADHIARCLGALDSQRGARIDQVVLLLNNCTDASEAVIERVRPMLDLPIVMHVRHVRPDLCTAGRARSEAMALAARVAGPHGIVATTDADGEVAPDWAVHTRAAFRAGVDAVCGRAEIDPADAMQISAALHEDDAREVAFGAMLDEIHALADPDPADPLPRHTEHSGASIAVTVAAWRRAGGMLPLPTGEDRGFLRSLRLVDATVRHAPDVRVTVSGRLHGRAAGGMAETMARRMIRQDEMLDADLEPAAICLRRATLRARARLAWRERGTISSSWSKAVQNLAADAQLPVLDVARWVRMARFGAAWAGIEAASPALIRIAVARGALDLQVAAAQRILTGLRGTTRVRVLAAAADVPAGRADSHPAAAALIA